MKVGSNFNRRWDGATVVCAASGPSLTAEDLAFVRDKGVKVITVNATFKLAPWADVCYGADGPFWDVYIEQYRKVATSEAWTMAAVAAKRHGLKCIGRANGEGYSPIRHTINTGGNSGYQAVHLAAYWGATRIILLGYDMQQTDGKLHWHGKHEGNLLNGRNYNFWVKRFTPLAKDLKKMGVEVINCTRQTALTCFKREGLESVVW